MERKDIRLSIKVSTFTTMMVVLSMLLAYNLTGRFRPDATSGWVLVFSGVSFLIGLLYTLFLDRIITLPVQRLVGYTSRLVEKDFQEPIEVASNDELGTLARAIDELRRSFLAQRASLTQLNAELDAKVALRTTELQEALEHLQATQEELLQAEKLASIGRLAGGIAHEINNPAGVILTHTGLLLELSRDEQIPADFTESLEVIDRQVNRIAAITRDLLLFSRRAPLQKTPVRVRDVLHWTWSAYIQRARSQGVVFEAPQAPPIMVLGDTHALEQVFSNLVKNALDALEHTVGGEIRFEVSVRTERVLIAVKDNGPGIPEDARPRLFDPFFTTKQVGKGTGLGLAITYGILQELGGILEAANLEGGGAVFTVDLSRAVGPEAEARAAALAEISGSFRIPTHDELKAVGSPKEKL